MDFVVFMVILAVCYTITANLNNQTSKYKNKSKKVFVLKGDKQAFILPELFLMQASKHSFSLIAVVFRQLLFFFSFFFLFFSTGKFEWNSHFRK